MDIEKIILMYQDISCSILDICNYYHKTLIEMTDIFKQNGIALKPTDVGHVANRFKTIYISKEDLYYQFITLNKPRKKVAEYFGCSEALIKKKCALYGIKKSQSLAAENATKTLVDKYGTTKLADVSKEKRKQTNREKYGADYPFQSFEIQKKIGERREPSQEELRILKLLQALNIPYEREVPFHVEDRAIIMFDIKAYLPDGSFILIEIDGYFHNEDCKFDNIDKIERDRYKDDFCKENNIQLLRFTDDMSNIEICKTILKWY